MRRVLGLAAALAVGLAIWDFRTPAEVAWQDAAVGAAKALRAEGLVLQDQRGDEIWATRGYALYRSRGGAPFERVTTLVPRLGPAWAGFSRTFRDAFRYQELAELMALDEQTLLVFAGGDAVRVDLASGEAQRVHQLRYFGPDRGRGLMPHGLTRDASGAIYYGEYPTAQLAPGETVRVWRSRDEGRSWEVAHEFAAGTVRHVHAVQWDEFAQALWVATGDDDASSRIGYSRDGGATFTWIGAGSQTFRAVSLLFTREAVSWVMDSPKAPTRFVRWERSTRVVRESATVLPSPGYYIQPLGGERGLATLAERAAAVWLVGDGEPRELANWPVEPRAGRPHPVVRLLRNAAPGSVGGELFVNPLRTRVDQAAIYRVQAAAVFAR